jgi:nitric oxide reductase NorQ protein
LVAAGVGLEAASHASIVLPITDDLDVRQALAAAIAACVQ